MKNTTPSSPAHQPPDDYLRFTHDWRVPPDNGSSDIRMIKLRQSVGCQRTSPNQTVLRDRSYLSTAAEAAYSSTPRQAHRKPALDARCGMTASAEWDLTSYGPRPAGLPPRVAAQSPRDFIRQQCPQWIFRIGRGKPPHQRTCRVRTATERGPDESITDVADRLNGRIGDVAFSVRWAGRGAHVRR
jgi:hypothetical protein